MNSCELKCDLVDEYLNGSLAPQLQAQFQSHLRNCDSCAEAVSDWKLINAALQHSFESIAIPYPERYVKQQPGQNETNTSDSALIVLSLAASLLLAITISLTWLNSESNNHSGEAIVNRQSRNIAADDSTIYANVVFDEKTIAVRQCDGPEFTMYRVFPKVTVGSLE